MEKRIAAALIIINEKEHVDKLNNILSEFAPIIVARQGVPFHDRQLSVITIVLEGETDEINSLTGKLGRLHGIQVKTVFSK